MIINVILWEYNIIHGYLLLNKCWWQRFKTFGKKANFYPKMVAPLKTIKTVNICKYEKWLTVKVFTTKNILFANVLIIYSKMY